MNTETPETIEVTSDVITDDGMTVTPTRSPVKVRLFERRLVWILMTVVLVVGVCFGYTKAFTMGISAQTNEITRTTYNQAGSCLRVQSFMIHTHESGENPALFAKYQAEHPNESPIESKINHGCPIPFESNAQH